MSYEVIRNEIHAACVRLNDAGLISGSSGNVSVRLEPKDGQELFAITPSSIPYRLLQPEQIVVINGEREVVDGTDRPSVEVHLHVAAYRARPDVGSVVHSHSIFASGLAVAGTDLPPLIDEQIVTLGGGAICAEWGMSGSEDLATKVVTALDYRKCALLRSHGAVSVGKTLEDALEAAFLLERMSHIYILARQLGNVEKLPQNVIDLEIKFYKIKNGLPTE
jgi:L-fuculose-phosphate aldolase